MKVVSIILGDNEGNSFGEKKSFEDESSYQSNTESHILWPFCNFNQVLLCLHFENLVSCELSCVIIVSGEIPCLCILVGVLITRFITEFKL